MIIAEATGCGNAPRGSEPRGAPSRGVRASGPLGIVTKTPTFEQLRGSQADDFDPATGEITQPSPQIARANRWALKSVVNKILPGSRTAKCMVLRAPIPGYGLADIDLCKSQTHGKAFYQGLMACGSVWSCPVCAAKIAERRRHELKEAIDAAKAKGMLVHFVTLTVPHGIGDDINDLNNRLSKALSHLTNGGGSFKNQLKAHDPDIQLYGTIRAFEVTHSNVNGFHPHYHILVFTNDQIRSDGLQPLYRAAWKRACRLAQLPEPHHEIGCTVQDGSQASKYASKWGLEDEMTKSHTKQTRRKGATPWGLLRAFLDGNDPDYTPERAAALFKVYANAFKGRRQLYWSNGLRKLLELSSELTDQELVSKPEDERATLLATLTVHQWRAVRRAGQEAHLLTVAEAAPALLDGIIAGITQRAVPSPRSPNRPPS